MSRQYLLSSAFQVYIFGTPVQSVSLVFTLPCPILFDPIAMTSSPDQRQCSSHRKPLEVYCDTCDELICHFCTIKQHRGHECDAITDAFPRHQQQIVEGIQQVEEKLSAMTTAVQAVETQKGGFLEQVGAVRREIEATVQQLNQQLTRELDQVTDNFISARKKEADNVIAQLKSCKDFVEEELRTRSEPEILVLKRQMVECMAAACSLVKEDNLQPLEETRVRFAKNSSVLEAPACRSLGSVVMYGQLKAAGDKTSFDLCSSAPHSLVIDVINTG